MQPAFRRQALDGRDRRPVGLHGQHRAALDGHAIHDDGAGAALARVTSDVGARQPEVLAEELDEHPSRFHVHRAGDAVDDEGDLLCHREPPTLDGSTRSGSTADVVKTLGAASMVPPKGPGISRIGSPVTRGGRRVGGRRGRQQLGSGPVWRVKVPVTLPLSLTNFACWLEIRVAVPWASLR